MEERKYRVKQSWIFNLESMDDKLWVLIDEIREGKCEKQFVLDKWMDEYQLSELRDECAELACKAWNKVTSREYGRIKKIVSWRCEARYARCIAAGMPERFAGECFSDI